MGAPDALDDLLGAVRRFGAALAPDVRTEAARNGLIPQPVLADLLALGVQRAPFPARCGGSGLGQYGYVAALGELGKTDASLGAVVMATVSACTLLHQFGTSDQRRRWMRPILAGAGLAAIAVSERGAGSDPSRTTLRAETDGAGTFRLHGHKAFITNAAHPDLATVVTLGREAEAGLSCFVLRGQAPGLTASGPLRLIGWRAAAVGDLVFDGCRAERIGVPGKGLSQMLAVLTYGRMAIAALGAGLCAAALERALGHTLRTGEGGHRLWDHEAVSTHLVEMWVHLHIAAALAQAAARAADRGEDIRVSSAMAKLVASRSAVDSARSAVQVLGADGVSADGPIGRLYGDAKVLEIVEGTSEIQRTVLARALEGMGEGLA